MNYFNNRDGKKVLLSIKVSTIVFILLGIIVTIIIAFNVHKAISTENNGNIENSNFESKEVGQVEREQFDRGADVSSRGMEGSRIQDESIEIKEEVLDTNIPVAQVTTAGDILNTEVQAVTTEAVEEPQEEQQQEQQPEQEGAVQENNVQTISIDQVTISKDMDLTQRTGLSRDDFITLMAGVKADTSGFFEENAGLIYDMCEKYQLNEIFFCGLISAESGWTIASNHRRTHNYISLMSSGGLIAFSSLEEGMEKAAKTLHDRYLTPGGSFYYGKTLDAMRTKFCPANPRWTNLVYERMAQIVK